MPVLFHTTASGTYAIYDLAPDLSFMPDANAYVISWAGFDPGRDEGFRARTMDATGSVMPAGDLPTRGRVSTVLDEAAVI